MLFCQRSRLTLPLNVLIPCLTSLRAAKLAPMQLQMALEMQAPHILVNPGTHHPLMALQITDCTDFECRRSVVTPYAGPSLILLREGPWSQLTAAELVRKCRRLAACAATTLTILEQVVSSITNLQYTPCVRICHSMS